MSVTKYCLLLFLLIVNFTSNAQPPFGENVIQEPLKTMYPSVYPEKPVNVKSFTYVIDKDTISEINYDKTGNELSRYEEFRKSKPLYRSENKFTGKLKSETNFYINDVLKNTTIYKYDKQGNLIEWKKNKIVPGTQTQKASAVLDVHWLIEYANNKMTTAYALNQQYEKIQFYNYTYDSKNNLIETDELQWKDKYDYDNNSVVKKSRIFKNDNSVYSFTDYKYNDQNLLIETIDKNLITEYNYDLKTLKNIKYKKRSDSSYQEIKFIYKDNLVSKVDIHSNNPTLNFTSPAFIFKTNYLYDARKQNGLYNFGMEFLYDKYKNVTEIKYFVNAVYKYSKLFIYEYH